jgi:hypothetical protein
MTATEPDTRNEANEETEDPSLLEDEIICASCGSRDDVQPHPRMECVLFCVECLEIALGPMDRRRFGIGTQS